MERAGRATWTGSREGSGDRAGCEGIKHPGYVAKTPFTDWRDGHSLPAVVDLVRVARRAHRCRPRVPVRQAQGPEHLVEGLTRRGVAPFHRAPPKNHELPVEKIRANLHSRK
jgi:hypothetical protein